MATLVVGDPKVSFSIATTLRCRRRRYSIPWIAPLYPWSVPYNAVLSKVPFLSLRYDSTWDWTPVSQDHWQTSTHWANCLVYTHHHHHHHVTLSARIFLTLFRHLSLSSIASGMSSGLHPVSAQSCCIYVRAGCPDFARPCEGVHRSTLITGSSLFLQQCSACLVRLILIVFVTGGRWLYSCCFVGCCLQDLFNIARSILV